MIRFLSCAVLAFLPPAAAMSEDMQFDTNGNGVVTLDEVQANFPDMTVKDFMAMDLDADGSLDTKEVDAAEEAGMMPPEDTDS